MSSLADFCHEPLGNGIPVHEDSSAPTTPDNPTEDDLDPNEDFLAEDLELRQEKITDQQPQHQDLVNNHQIMTSI